MIRRIKYGLMGLYYHWNYPMKVLMIDTEDFRKRTIRRATWREVWDFTKNGPTPNS